MEEITEIARDLEPQRPVPPGAAPGGDPHLVSLGKIAVMAIRNMTLALTPVGQAKEEQKPPAIDKAPPGIPQEKWDGYALDQKKKVIAVRKAMGLPT